MPRTGSRKRKPSAGKPSPRHHTLIKRLEAPMQRHNATLSACAPAQPVVPILTQCAQHVENLTHRIASAATRVYEHANLLRNPDNPDAAGISPKEEIGGLYPLEQMLMNLERGVDRLEAALNQFNR